MLHTGTLRNAGREHRISPLPKLESEWKGLRLRAIPLHVPVLSVTPTTTQLHPPPTPSELTATRTQRMSRRKKTVLKEWTEAHAREKIIKEIKPSCSIHGAEEIIKKKKEKLKKKIYIKTEKHKNNTPPSLRAGFLINNITPCAQCRDRCI